MQPLLEALAALDAKTMILMAAVLYFSLTMVMFYTYFFRKTYPGFASLALGQLFWSLGVYLVFYRVLGDRLSLALSNGLLFLQAVCWHHGIAMYGGITPTRPRLLVNAALAVLAELGILYYLYVDFNTCRRVVIFSSFCALLYSRIALEPYLVRRWKTYPMQGIYSGIFLCVAMAYAVRAFQTVNATNCQVGGPDAIVKLLLLSSMGIFAFLTFCVLSMTSSRVEAELREAHDALRQLAQTDALTGLSNRRHFLEQAQAVLEDLQAQGGRASLIMLDLDHFKRINDVHGHQAGDLALREAARHLRAALREGDVIGRLGGEEFGVLLPGLDSGEALAVARQLRRAVAASRPGGLRVTASFGLADGPPQLDSLLVKADEYLYAAKEAGRDRIAWSGGLVTDNENGEASA
ncbi:MAG: diguanylate cyclase (GGDEF) domain-containing protein [Solidesulfovibrio magneticus str. Maddingley MBC34]|uniref:diguanylate cyclase n=1 Tax=Solidesulfovibrio magneticus str. Maddingley MBC34 TaxID=1206767 RepID=K6FFR1_9BACT|nr:MAG: diguanylate cyclase (GGDEF) domain-containing protein [Solidesulfovibrio magneticus str. Maddingley MBC34]